MSTKHDVMVRQIHGEFDTAADDLLVQAQKLVENAPVRADLLHALGMVHQEETKQAFNVKGNLASIQKAQEYFPGYKIMPTMSLYPILKKYKLACAPLPWFKGEFPTQNLMETQNFMHLIEQAFNKACRERHSTEERESLYYQTLRIVAPLKDIVVPHRQEVIGHGSGWFSLKPAPRDPVVLFEYYELCIVVTKWGVEADYAEFR